jgi:hypothetical protein
VNGCWESEYLSSWGCSNYFIRNNSFSFPSQSFYRILESIVLTLLILLMPMLLNSWLSSRSLRAIIFFTNFLPSFLNSWRYYSALMSLDYYQSRSNKAFIYFPFKPFGLALKYRLSIVAYTDSPSFQKLFFSMSSLRLALSYAMISFSMIKKLRIISLFTYNFFSSCLVSIFSYPKKHFSCFP